MANNTKIGYLIDMDGVIYKGSKAIEGAYDFIHVLQSKNIPYVFLTNNSGYTPTDIVRKLESFDIITTEDHVFTCAQATADFLHQQKPGGKAYVIGEAGLYSALYSVGYEMVQTNPDYVVVGEGRSFTAETLEKAHRMIDKGAHLISTNSDTWCPTDNGPRPGCGAIVALLEAATGAKAYHVGKPNPFIFRKARKRLGLNSDQVVMIGDTMETDIKGATDLDFRSVLVLTGSTTRESVTMYPFQPTYMVESIGEVLKLEGLWDAYKNLYV
jgi:NagD protein